MAGRRFKLAALVLAVALLFSSTAAQAQSSTLPVIIKVAPLSSITRILNSLTGGTVVDSIPGADIYLLNLPNIPLVQQLLATPTALLQLLGVDWLEINTGVA